MLQSLTTPHLKWSLGWLALAGASLWWWQVSQLTTEGNLPWRHGSPSARFTLVVNPGRISPERQVYLTKLLRWVVTAPDVDLQLNATDLHQQKPLAGEHGRLAQCIDHFKAWWDTAMALLGKADNEMDGTTKGSYNPCYLLQPPDCFSHASFAHGLTPGNEGAQEDALSTAPSLLLIDHQTQRMLVLQGLLEPDALGSALDWLIASETSEMPADDISDMPR